MGFKLNIQDRNLTEEGHRVYKSQVPMDPQNLPAPYATLGPDITEWEDGVATPGETYYYRVSAFTGGGSVELVSDEIELVAVQPDFPTLGMLIHFEPNQVTNGELINLAGNANGTLFGTTLVTDPVVGPAREFVNPTGSGTTTDLVIVDLGETSNKRDITVAVWFKTSDTSTTFYLFAQRVSSRRVRGIACTSAGIFANGRDATQSSSNNAYHQTEPALGYQDGNWHLAVYQQEGPVLRLYLDGGANVREYTMPSVDEGAFHPEILFGAQKSSITTGDVAPNNGFIGQMAAQRFYDRILSPAEIDQLYSQHGGA